MVCSLVIVVADRCVFFAARLFGVPCASSVLGGGGGGGFLWGFCGGCWGFFCFGVGVF